MIYDIFYVSRTEVNEDSWNTFRQRFPSAQKIDNIKTLTDAAKKSFTKFFWLVWDDLIVEDTFNFDYRVEKWDEEYIHVWLNGLHRDGICLFPKNIEVIKKEFNHRFYFKKKEIDVVASRPKPFDIIFISYNEPNADLNYQRLLEKFPRAKRVHGVKGIHNAHKEAARISETDMFWVVDADAELVDDFNFEINYFPHYDAGNRREHLKTVYVWHSKNPVNELTYGYGGVKLLPKQLTLDMNTETHDMTTSISDRFKVMAKVSNITAFNTDEFTTWRSAFRECAKLASKVIDSNYDPDTDERLYIWCSKTADKVAAAGAKEGRKFGRLNIDEPDELRKINDFDWLRERFETWKAANEQQR